MPPLGVLGVPLWLPSLQRTATATALEIMDLDPLDPEYVAATLSRLPFVSIGGVVNVRDLGHYPTHYPGLVTRPGIAYRAGEISHITPEGAHIPMRVAWIFL